LANESAGKSSKRRALDADLQPRGRADFCRAIVYSESGLAVNAKHNRQPHYCLLELIDGAIV
jgi:hypothetical protein